MAATATIDLNLNYSQILALVKQLSGEQQQRLMRDVRKSSRTDGFRKLIKNVPDIDDNTILAECKAARRDINNRIYGK
ncbi:MAG: hypothetical protein IKZ99_01295 [Salinivirgaceae bacterium]|nr:hypothetical protein [Salinivirgaceae bacterium]